MSKSRKIARMRQQYRRHAARRAIASNLAKLARKKSWRR